MVEGDGGVTVIRIVVGVYYIGGRDRRQLDLETVLTFGIAVVYIEVVEVSYDGGRRRCALGERRWISSPSFDLGKFAKKKQENDVGE